jgi:hypothetical protein
VLTVQAGVKAVQDVFLAVAAAQLAMPMAAVVVVARAIPLYPLLMTMDEAELLGVMEMLEAEQLD